MSATGVLYNCMATAPLESAALQGAAPLGASSTIVRLLLLWSPLIYGGLLPGGFLHNYVAASLEFAAAPLEAFVFLATASPLRASSIMVMLLLLWSLLIYRGLHVPLEASSTIVWLLLLWSPLLYRGRLPGGFLCNCVASAPLESAALQRAARWGLPSQVCGCFSSGVRCSTWSCMLCWRRPPQLFGCCSSRARCCFDGGVRLSGNCFSAGGFLYTGLVAAPLESAALQGAARWRLPPQLCGCCSSRVRCSTGGCSSGVRCST
jgi:hypothetical protein